MPDRAFIVNHIFYYHYLRGGLDTLLVMLSILCSLLLFPLYITVICFSFLGYCYFSARSLAPLSKCNFYLPCLL